jgi:G:T-mismatch repair DNA endonuclease (very short patch repair protein)
MERFCHICKQQIHHQSHLKVCAKNHGIEKSFIDLKIDMLLFNMKGSISDLINEYNEGYSINDAANKYGLYYRDVQQLLDFYNVVQRKLKDSQTKKVREKYIKTCNEKYGVDNVSQHDAIKKQKAKTFIKNHGVDNIFKAKIFKEWLNEYMLDKYGKKRITDPDKISEVQQNFTDAQWFKRLQKIQKTCNERFGYDNYSKVPEQRKNISKKSKERWENLTDDEKDRRIFIWRNSPNNMSFISKLECRISRLLTELQIEFTVQKRYKKRLYDFYVECLDMFIEVNGDYWHANPLLYNANDTLHYPNNNLCTARDVWGKDKIKNDNVTNDGHSLIVIWESEMKNLDDEQLTELIIEKVEQIMKNKK